MKLFFMAMLLLWTPLVVFATQPIQIVTTLPDFKNFAEVIGKDKVQVVSITSGRMNPHHFEIKPSDILKVKKADLLIINGLDLDNWIYPLIANSRNPKIQKGASGFIDPSAVIKVLDIPKTKVDRSQGDIHPFGNPHYNLSPRNMRLAFNHILKVMTENYPQYQNEFNANGQTYLKQLDQKIEQWHAALKNKKDLRIVSFHNSWSYFFNEFNFLSGGYMEPQPGIAPSPVHTAELIQKIKTEKTSYIFKEVYFSNQIPEYIASKTDAQVIPMPTYVGSIPEAKDYIALIDLLVNRIQ